MIAFLMQKIETCKKEHKQNSNDHSDIIAVSYILNLKQSINVHQWEIFKKQNLKVTSIS